MVQMKKRSLKILVLTVHLHCIFTGNYTFYGKFSLIIKTKDMPYFRRKHAAPQLHRKYSVFLRYTRFSVAFILSSTVRIDDPKASSKFTLKKLFLYKLQSSSERKNLLKNRKFSSTTYHDHPGVTADLVPPRI